MVAQIRAKWWEEAMASGDGRKERRPLAICLLAFCHARGHMRDACAPREGRLGICGDVNLAPQARLSFPSLRCRGRACGPLQAGLAHASFERTVRSCE